MNRQDWRDFYRWLETASLPELRATLEKIEATLPFLKDREVRGEALRMRRAMEAEILERASRP